MNELKALWSRTLGPPPPDEQFFIWMESHDTKIVRTGILKAAAKNQAMLGQMSQDHRVRFASKVMSTLTALAKEHAANKEKLAQEFGGNR